MTRLSGSIFRFVIVYNVLALIFVLPVVAESATTIYAEDLKAAISAYVEKNRPEASEGTRVNFLSKMSDLVLPYDSVKLEVSSRPGEDFIADTVVTVALYSGKSLIDEIRVRVIIDIMTNVVVTNKDIMRNYEIGPEDVSVLKKWVRRMPTNVVTLPSDVIGKMLTVNLKRNNEITTNILRTPLLIKKRNIVRIALENDNLLVTTLGVSEEDGVADRIIKVRNLSSNKTIYARVVGDSLVKVEF
jgi:flagellar basal body P-ring formation protein FlgA